MQGYIVQKVGYEYNDEYYHRGEGGGNPVVVYTNQKKAEKKAEELSLKFFKACEIGSYISGCCYGKKREALNEKLKKILGEGAGSQVEEDSYEYSLPAGLDEKKLKEVYDAFNSCLGLCFYEVIETEIEK